MKAAIQVVQGARRKNPSLGKRSSLSEITYHISSHIPVLIVNLTGISLWYEDGFWISVLKYSQSQGWFLLYRIFSHLPKSLLTYMETFFPKNTEGVENKTKQCKIASEPRRVQRLMCYINVTRQNVVNMDFSWVGWLFPICCFLGEDYTSLPITMGLQSLFLGQKCNSLPHCHAWP